MTKQNKTHAVMSQRHEDKDSKDYFPTPPWATRALFEKVLKKYWRIPDKFTGRYGHINCLEPACGAGHMTKVLKEYFDTVVSADIDDYGQDRIADFLKTDEKQKYHYIVTNPPFNLAEEFVLKALKQARYCVAIFARTQFLESVGRYERLFKETHPDFVAQFTEQYQSLKESYRQRRPQLRAMLGLFGKALKKMKGRLEQIWFGYHHVEVSLKRKGTTKRVCIISSIHKSRLARDLFPKN